MFLQKCRNFVREKVLFLDKGAMNIVLSFTTEQENYSLRSTVEDETSLFRPKPQKFTRFGFFWFRTIYAFFQKSRKITLSFPLVVKLLITTKIRFGLFHQNIFSDQIGAVLIHVIHELYSEGSKRISSNPRTIMKDISYLKISVFLFLSQLLNLRFSQWKNSILLIKIKAYSGLTGKNMFTLLHLSASALLLYETQILIHRWDHNKEFRWLWLWRQSHWLQPSEGRLEKMPSRRIRKSTNWNSSEVSRVPNEQIVQYEFFWNGFLWNCRLFSRFTSCFWCDLNIFQFIILFFFLPQLVTCSHPSFISSFQLLHLRCETIRKNGFWRESSLNNYLPTLK